MENRLNSLYVKMRLRKGRKLMKPDKHSFIRILAILLSVFLVMSNPGFSVYAEDFLSAVSVGREGPFRVG